MEPASIRVRNTVWFVSDEGVIYSTCKVSLELLWIDNQDQPNDA